MVNGVKILIVEDDALIGAELVSTLADRTYSVLGPITAGEDVLAAVQMHKPDVILMDITLSGAMDGIQAAQLLQEQKSSVPVVFLSAFHDEITLQRAKLTNPYGYLIKPFDASELHATIQVTVQRYRQEPREVTEDIVLNTGNFTESGAIGIAATLKPLPLFEGINERSIDSLAQSCVVKEFCAGEYLANEGDVGSGGYIPLTGRVSITKTSIAGKELIVSLLGPGDSYGLICLSSLLDGAISARAQVDSKILWIQKNAWKFMLDREPQLYKNISEAMAARLQSAYTLSSSLAHARVEGRIISTLIALLPQFGRSSAKDNCEERIFITRKELAELTGTTPETAIRVTKSLERQGLLDLTRPGIIKIPDTKKLRIAA